MCGSQIMWRNAVHFLSTSQQHQAPYRQVAVRAELGQFKTLRKVEEQSSGLRLPKSSSSADRRTDGRSMGSLTRLRGSCPHSIM